MSSKQGINDESALNLSSTYDKPELIQLLLSRSNLAQSARIQLKTSRFGGPSASFRSFRIGANVPTKRPCVREALRIVCFCEMAAKEHVADHPGSSPPSAPPFSEPTPPPFAPPPCTQIASLALKIDFKSDFRAKDETD